MFKGALAAFLEGFRVDVRLFKFCLGFSFRGFYDFRRLSLGFRYNRLGFGFGLAYGVFLNSIDKGLQIFCHRNSPIFKVPKGNIHEKKGGDTAKAEFFRFFA